MSGCYSILAAALDVRTASHVVTEPELASRDELGEPSQLFGGSDLRARETSKLEHKLTSFLEFGIIERFRLVERSPVAPVALVEAAPLDKVRQCHTLRRHVEQSRTECGGSAEIRAQRTRIS
jgi:hypothetical protein